MSTIQVNAIQSSTGTQEVTQTTIFSGTAKAWYNLNGTGTIAERDSFNISSYDDNGTGHYSANLANSMADANATAACSIGYNATLSNDRNVWGQNVFETAAIITMKQFHQSVGARDIAHVQGSGFGDFA